MALAQQAREEQAGDGRGIPVGAAGMSEQNWRSFREELSDPKLRLESYQHSFAHHLGVRCMADVFDLTLEELEEEMNRVVDVDSRHMKGPDRRRLRKEWRRFHGYDDRTTVSGLGVATGGGVGHPEVFEPRLRQTVCPGCEPGGGGTLCSLHATAAQCPFCCRPGAIAKVLGNASLAGSRASDGVLPGPAHSLTATARSLAATRNQLREADRQQLLVRPQSSPPPVAADADADSAAAVSVVGQCPLSGTDVVVAELGLAACGPLCWAHSRQLQMLSACPDCERGGTGARCAQHKAAKEERRRKRELQRQQEEVAKERLQREKEQQKLNQTCRVCLAGATGPLCKQCMQQELKTACPRCETGGGGPLCQPHEQKRLAQACPQCEKGGGLGKLCYPHERRREAKLADEVRKRCLFLPFSVSPIEQDD